MPATARNVFVLCTGRCGSTTFAESCRHITNYSAGHESGMALLGAARMNYPPGHIEVDNRLSWMLGRLQKRYGATAHYVHLLRDPAATAASFAKRKGYGILAAYRRGILMQNSRAPSDAEATLIAADMIDTMTENIRVFLQGKPNVMTIQLETIEQDFPKFWSWIGAEGDLSLALAEWSVHHNATEKQA